MRADGVRYREEGPLALHGKDSRSRRAFFAPIVRTLPGLGMPTHTGREDPLFSLARRQKWERSCMAWRRQRFFLH